MLSPDLKAGSAAAKISLSDPRGQQNASPHQETIGCRLEGKQDGARPRRPTFRRTQSKAFADLKCFSPVDVVVACARPLRIAFTAYMLASAHCRISTTSSPLQG